MTRVGLVFGGRSAEHLVSVTSARTIIEGLRSAGHEVIPIGIAQDGCFVSVEIAQAALDGEVDVIAASSASTPPAIIETLVHFANAKPDVIFPIVHGTYGEDGTLQGLCAMANLPCVGASVTTSALAMDKVLTKSVLRDAGIPVVEGAALSRVAFDAHGLTAPELDDLGAYPLFVKPSVGGSSVGCQKAGNDDELKGAIAFAFRFCDQVLIERAVDAREVECAVLGSEEEGFEASCLGEIIPGSDFYDYEDKYLNDSAGLLAPANIDPDTTASMRKQAIAAFAALGGGGMARVDFFVEKNPAAKPGATRVLLNEINTLPGFTSISMYPKLWGLSGKPIAKLCDRLVALALTRHQRQARLDRSVLAWIQEIERKTKPPQRT